MAARGLRTAAAALLAVYLLWQVIWLVEGRLPPSLYWGLTGWPSPTTGGVRAICCLVEGEWLQSLRYNPFAVPLTVLFLATLLAVFHSLLRDGRPRLSTVWLRAWWVCLALAWIVQTALAATGSGAG